MKIYSTPFRAMSIVLLVASFLMFGTGSFGQILSNFGYGYGYGYGEPDEPSLATVQKSILSEFYTSLNGDSWTKNDGWNEASSVCDWFGIACDSKGAIAQINLSQNNLSGMLIDAIWDLPDLNQLALFDNEVRGPIPETFLNENLETILLGHNNISGPIPDFSATAPNLKVLGLGSNQLNGAIPDSIGNIAGLEGLDLSDNQLTGPIPESIGDLVSLTLLNLHINKLTGHIPESFSRLANLTFLNLGQNELSGEVPDIFTNLSKLSHLDLSGNKFSGKLPALSGASLLMRVDLGSNAFSGDLNDSFSALPKLDWLYLVDNAWIGPPPGWLSDLSINGVEVVTEDKGRYAFTNVLPMLELGVDTSLRVDTEQDGNEVAVMAFSSSDIDGVISSYRLYRNNSLIYSGAAAAGTLTVPLVSGLNKLKFDVIDDRSGTTTLEKVIRVSAPPTVQITGINPIILDTDGLPGEFVTFAANVQDIDGDAFTVDWYVNGVKRGSGEELSNILLDNGDSDIEVIVIESGTELADRASVSPFVQVPIYQPSLTWPKAIVGEARDLSGFNNIAVIDIERGLMFACLSVVQGETTFLPISVRFLLNLGSEITLSIDATRGFNPTGAFMEDGTLPTCSGILDRDSGMYTDYIHLDGNDYELRFKIQGDSSSFIFNDFSVIN